MHDTSSKVPDDTPLAEVFSRKTLRATSDRARKVKTPKRGRSSIQFTNLIGPHMKNPSATRSVESSKELEEHLIRKRKNPSPKATSSLQAVYRNLQDAINQLHQWQQIL